MLFVINNIPYFSSAKASLFKKRVCTITGMNWVGYPQEPTATWNSPVYPDFLDLRSGFSFSQLVSEPTPITDTTANVF